MYTPTRSAPVKLHARAGLFGFALEFVTVVCMAGVVVDMYGILGTKLGQGARGGPPAAPADG